MPLTAFQHEVLAVLRPNRRPESHLAGASALHLDPESLRRSGDLDVFHDGVDAQRDAFVRDREALVASGFEVAVLKSFPGYTQAAITRDGNTTLVDWATDSDWRFLPVQTHPTAGYLLHPIDLAINKVLALIGRDEPRDYVDALWADAVILPLPALIWAASGKDPGLSPSSALSLLRRRGRPHPEEIARLDLTGPFDLEKAKTRWLSALDETEVFIANAPRETAGALFYDPRQEAFLLPSVPIESTIIVHHGARGGVVPVLTDGMLADTPQIRDPDEQGPVMGYPRDLLED